MEQQNQISDFLLENEVTALYLEFTNQNKDTITINEFMEIMKQINRVDITEDLIAKEIQKYQESPNSINLQLFIKVLKNLSIIKESSFQQIKAPILFTLPSKLVISNKVKEFSILDFTSDDIIDTIIKRINFGYSMNCSNNAKLMISHKDLFQKAQFSQDIWYWIQKCKEKASQINGCVELSALNQEQKNVNSQLKKIYNRCIYESKFRDESLAFLGWSTVQNRVENQQIDLCKQLERDQQYIRAATIALFHLNYALAYHYISLVQKDFTPELRFIKQILMGLKNVDKYIQSDGEIIGHFCQASSEPGSQLSKSMQSADYLGEKYMQKSNLLQSDFNIGDDYLQFRKNMEILDQISRVHVLKSVLNFTKLTCAESKFDNKYLEIICQFIYNNDNQSILSIMMQYDEINLIDKAGFILRFIPDEQINQVFDNFLAESQSKGLLDMIVCTGTQQDNFKTILQSFLNKTNDIQTVALLSINLFNIGFSWDKFHQFYFCYKDLINQLQLYKYRNMLESEIYDMKGHAQTVKKEIQNENQVQYITCNQCKTSLQFRDNQKSNQHNLTQSLLMQYDSNILDICFNCKRATPRCCVCHHSISILNPYYQMMKRKGGVTNIPDKLPLDEAIVWCQQCYHGGHYKHLRDWFSEYGICPESNCSCECNIFQ